MHHLIESRKRLVFSPVVEHLVPGGKAVFGDLMLENPGQRESKMALYREAGEDETVESIAEEFFWLLDEAVEYLETIGFVVTVKRFSDLSFGVLAEKPGGTV